ncbi:hypothetical protein Ahy_B10g102732 isoform B [Arachis hypogaea]|uniref:Uncharacterized protein n=1 Tax=Arachis hypogaea TaxID=3818 RepID=A0A444X2P0_ARAHY|nr:hypothetical protein Ahy_B10g102732 isoform B [Arachis hypogaea]
MNLSMNSTKDDLVYLAYLSNQKPPVPVGVCLILDYIAETLQQKQKWRNIKKPSSFHICYKFKQLVLDGIINKERSTSASICVAGSDPSLVESPTEPKWSPDDIMFHINSPSTRRFDLSVLGNTYQSKLLEELDQESGISSPKELESRSFEANNREA